MSISIYVAIAEDGAIGKNNALLWHLPADFALMKKHTMGKPLIMGRKTHESIGRPLPNRENIIITRQQNYAPLNPKNATNITVKNSLSDTLENLDNSLEYIIFGGKKIYQNSLPHANKIYLTRVHKSYPEADTHFPKINLNDWQETHREDHPAEPKNPEKSPAFTFQILERKTTP